MDPSYSIESIFDDDDALEEIPIPSRSPSRLDFCMEDLEGGASDLGGDPPTHALQVIGWAPFHGDRSCAFFEEEGLEVDIPFQDHTFLPIVQSTDGEESSPQTTDSDLYGNTPSPSPASQEHLYQANLVPATPTPVRPPPVQLQADEREPMPQSRTASQRLNYPHHGFSRSALQQQKSFWNVRREEWEGWRSRIQQDEQQPQYGIKKSDAYTGLATLQPPTTNSSPPMRTPPSGLERDLIDHPPKKPEQDPNSSIYPRVGDISALRDPYPINLDRSFFKYSLWTLHKALYKFDILQGSTLSVYTDGLGNVQTSVSSSTLSSYTSSASGDGQESDSTLVADDSPVPQSQHLKAPSKCTSSPRSSVSRKRCGGWYARWELLMDLFQNNQARCGSLGIAMELSESPELDEIPPPPLTPLDSLFRFPVGEEENMYRDEDDDDEEDYGTIVFNSDFNMDMDEECERAMAFYTRERKCAEVSM